MYSIRFEFDTENQPPKVIIYDNDGNVAEIFEEPTSHLGKNVEIEPNIFEWQGDFSWEQDDWEAGSIAKALLKCINDTTLNLKDYQISKDRIDHSSKNKLTIIN